LIFQQIGTSPTPTITGAMSTQCISTLTTLFYHASAELKLAAEQAAILLFDNFKGQCTPDLLKLLDSNNISVVLIPPNCTNRLQPLNLGVNKVAKEFLKRKFHEWYAKQVCTHIQGKTKELPTDLHLSTIKPLGAQWMLDLFDHSKGRPEMIRNEFKEAGLLL